MESGCAMLDSGRGNVATPVIPLRWQIGQNPDPALICAHCPGLGVAIVSGIPGLAIGGCAGTCV